MTDRVQASQSAEAWQILKKGFLLDNLKLQTIQLPALKPNQVLIKVAYAGLNPADYKITALMPSFVQKLPRTAASDFSGHVIGLGSDELKSTYPWLVEANVAVFGVTDNLPLPKYGVSGALSTFTIANADEIQPVPKSESAVRAGITLENAAGLAIAGGTAVALTNYIHKGDRVLINGGTSAVGLIAAELARAIGPSLIVATSSGAKVQFLQARGIDDVVDYRANDVSKELALRYGSQPFDVVLDTIGSQDLHAQSAAYLKPAGSWVNIGASAMGTHSSVFSPAVLSYIFWNVRGALPRVLGGHARALVSPAPDFKVLGTLRDHLDEGKVRLVTDEVFEWERVPDAFRKVIGGRALGKIIVKVGK